MSIKLRLVLTVDIEGNGVSNGTYDTRRRISSYT